ncbi:PREDICTED: lysosomal Pro-X carboxypeptidase isoform X3 [Lupinus angustifolius]|uniref:lysosomal Pro-X carboxypeptidase isoform X3 n=1 Tax=Lupinus angustifolius TaxID=3871 RepID=UPI00092E48F1|nr:PREDICTED: lysosomal Pro-X carboxypeptidase isoform X3 [Lupinus angustifolius]
MKSFTLLLLILSFILYPLPSSSSSLFKHRLLRTEPSSTKQTETKISYKTKYLQQNLDHFTFNNNLPTFPQRYLLNTDHWDPSSVGPIFFYCGNEGDIHNYSALLSPVVLFGGSYGGMLAAWMRLKYPHIAVGALAASAPILQFEDIIPPQTFYDIVSNDFRRESVTCFNYIKQSWDEIASRGQTNDGLVQLTRTFNFCQQLNSAEDLSGWLSSAYSYLAMVNYPYPSEFMMPLPGHPIKEVCRRIDGGPPGTSIPERIYEGVNVYYNYTGEAKCFELDDDPHGLSGWNWQACTEMVMPMSSSPDFSMFPPYEFNYSSFEEECLKEFGVKPRPKWITTEFGGHNIHATLKKFGSNIIFSNGLLDPWSGGSVLQNISESVVALVTEEGAHHIDLRASTKNDPTWLIEQRATEIKLIQGWISDHYQKNKVIFDM